MGEWHKKPREEINLHEHENPKYATNDEDVQKGDQYECSCGGLFEITDIRGTYAYGTENGIQSLAWRRVHSYGVKKDVRVGTPYDFF